MNYRLKSKPKYEHKGKIIAIAVVCIFLLGTSFLFPNFVRSSLSTISRPLWIAGSSIGSPFSGVKNYFVSKNVILSKNLELENEIQRLQLKEIDYDIISKQNEDLKNELGRKSESARIVSRVLSKPPNSPYDTLVIDVGSSSGVNVGSKVYLGESLIIGTVGSVTSNTALVELFSTGDRKQEAVLQRTGATFSLVGKGGANFQLEVPKDTDILWGDMFMYPSLSSSAIGSVYYIDTNSQSSFKTIYIRIPGNVFSTKYVFVE